LKERLQQGRAFIRQNAGGNLAAMIQAGHPQQV
jgi:hypothetical protein